MTFIALHNNIYYILENRQQNKIINSVSYKADSLMLTHEDFAELSGIVLYFHLVIILFIIFGFIAVPLGAKFKKKFIYEFWWRLTHLAAMVVVAVQAMLGKACFLTYIQSDLLESAGKKGYTVPFIQTYIDRIIYHNFPIWMFSIVYVFLFLYTLYLWFKFPPKIKAGS